MLASGAMCGCAVSGRRGGPGRALWADTWSAPTRRDAMPALLGAAGPGIVGAHTGRARTRCVALRSAAGADSFREACCAAATEC